MPKREDSKPYGIEVQKGPIRMDEQYNLAFDRQPQAAMLDMEHLNMRVDKMTLTLHTPKK